MKNNETLKNYYSLDFLIENSFNFLKNNFLYLFIPTFLFYIVLYYIFLIIAGNLFNGFDKVQFYTEGNYKIIILSFCLLFVYLTIEIGFILGLYKTIKDIYNKQKINLIENYKYGFLNIYKSFQTYYYIFMYIYFIPFLIFMFAGVYFIYIQEANILVGRGTDHILNFILIGAFLIIGFLIYVSYKSNKTIFSITSAISEESFDKENFKQSVFITNGNWWRIFLNFLIIAIIIYIITAIINFIFGLVVTTTSNDGIYAIIENAVKSKNVDKQQIFELIKSNFEINFSNVSKEIFSRITMSLGIIYTSIFTYIFCKGLQEEKEIVLELDFNIEKPQE